MGSRKNIDPLAGLDGEAIGRELDKLLAEIGPETERILAELPRPKPETRRQMNARHARLGRMLQRAGLAFLQKKATTRDRRTCA
jgi:hypothetical protein